MKNIYSIYILSLVIFVYGCSRETTTEPVDDGIPPTAPAGLNVYYEADGEVGIEWIINEDASIERYNIYKSVNDSINMALVNSTYNDYYTESDLDYDSIYYYRVTAVDIFENESGFSKTVSAKPLNIYSPYPPNRLSIHAQNWYDTLSITLTWYPPADNDIKGYRIYRNLTDEFNEDSSEAIAFVASNSFKDTINLEVLTEYYYRVTAIDRGDLSSNFSLGISDIIFDRPELVSPSDGSEINRLDEIRIRSISLPANYKIIIQENPLFDVVYEKSFSISEIKTNISIQVEWYSYEYYKKYYWRVITYSSQNNETNSFSDLFSFTIVQ